ncbi:hypothetical protein [Pseudoflavonifractor sp. 524-17]|uniref:hypothetical protein n=1 Tax=Pseudoflavonifractor sp. 524-17 TaxID=2304577 RepID=UPI00137B40A9|nr:hypothetical protein [Pseudoflavonifractor sp. 524-17]
MGHKLVIGADINNPECQIEDGDIVGMNGITAVDLVGSELSIDTLTASVDFYGGDTSYQLIVPKYSDIAISTDGYAIASNQVYANPRNLNYGTLVRYFRDGTLACKMYLSDVKRMAKNRYWLHCVSPVGLLEGQMHYGGIYHGESFASVASEIIGNSVPFSMAEEVRNIKVYGWLPYGTKRSNLHQLLFATGVMIGRNAAGDMEFRFISNKDVKDIPKKRIYYDGSVEYPALVSAVDVTEHSFFALSTDETVTVYDNTDGSETADNTFLAFPNGPLHSLSTTGSLVIHSSGVNWAVVTGTGILTGKKFTHSTRILRKQAPGRDTQRENVKKVAEAYLVNATNSDNVASRVLAYFSSHKTVTASIVEDGERPGDMITGYDPYDEPISGIIASMQSNVSSNIKSECKIITDYSPIWQGNNYTKYTILTGSGVWTIPAEILAKPRPILQAVIIGAGDGGFAGADGEPGANGVYQSYDYTPAAPPGGKGGAAGGPGTPGKVLTVTIDCTGLTAINYACGVGGASNARGGASVFGAYSSDSGVTPQNGIANIFSGEIYATKNVPGVDGGRGREANDYDFPGEPTVYGWKPGEDGQSDRSEGHAPGAATAVWVGVGGHGGGAAYGSNGQNGGDGSGRGDSGYGGAGGAGANGANGANATVLGGAGAGGNGGGGGGSGGNAYSYRGQAYARGGAGGPGGKGGAGGNGGPGGILIYY